MLRDDDKLGLLVARHRHLALIGQQPAAAQMLQRARKDGYIKEA